MTYDWDELKPQICELYLNKGLTLEEVAKEVNTSHGVDIRNRTFREKLKEWGCRKQDHRGSRRKSRTSVISNDSGYVSYAAQPNLSRTTTNSTNSWHASNTTLVPSVLPSPSIKSSYSDDISFRSSTFLPSPPKRTKNKPLPSIPQSEPVDVHVHRHSVSALPLRPPSSNPSLNVPPHPPGSQCRRARSEPDGGRIATLEKCSSCSASVLHAKVAGAHLVSVDTFRLMVEKDKALINARDIFGNTPLHAAAAAGLGVDDLRFLQSVGAELFARNEKGELFLHLLHPHHKHESLIKILDWAFEQKVDFRLTTYDGTTVLHALCKHNMSTFALQHMWSFLRSLGSDINVRDRWGKNAVDYMKIALEKELSQGAQPSVSAQGLETLISSNLPRYESRQETDVAPQEDMDAVVQAMMRDPEQIQQSDRAMFEVFRESEINPSVQDHHGRNALHCLAYILRFWDFGNRRLFHPAEARLQGVLSALRWKVPLNTYDRYGLTPLHSFLAYPRYNESGAELSRIIETLLMNGADPITRDREGNTALHIACSNGRVEGVEALLRFLRRDVHLHRRATSARNNKGRTPVQDVLAWISICDTPEDKELRRQCLRKIAGEEFTEVYTPPTFWGIPHSTPSSSVVVSPEPSLRPATPMDIS